MKKIVVKYLIEFIVIVVGISVSFWFDKYQISLDNIQRENQVIQELLTELKLIDSTVENREKVFKYDFENLNHLIQDNIGSATFTYEELLIATTDYRGFSPSDEIYTSLKYDGGLKFIRNNQIKIAIEALYNGTKYGVIANMEDEIVVQRDVLKYIQFNFPSLLIELEQKNLTEEEKIKAFAKTVQSDKTLKSLLSSKLRFMGNKLKFLEAYKQSLSRLKKLISEHYEIGKLIAIPPSKS